MTAPANRLPTLLLTPRGTLDVAKRLRTAVALLSTTQLDTARDRERMAALVEDLKAMERAAGPGA